MENKNKKAENHVEICLEAERAERCGRSL